MKLFNQLLFFLIGTSLVFADPKSLSSEKTSPSDSPKPPAPSDGQQQKPILSSEQSGSNPPKQPMFMMSGTQRKKTVKDDHIKVKKYHTFATQHDSLPAPTNNDVSTPEIESEAYFGYPMTLDYVVDVYVESTDGTVSSYSVIADTGSSNLAISVADCGNCGSGSSDLEVDYYSPEMCVEVTYGSGSWSGLMTDLTFVGMGTSELGTDIYFSAITDGSSFFTSSGFQGILGLGYSGITSDYSTCTTSKSSLSTKNSIDAIPYTDSLSNDEIIDTNIFTMSFCGSISEIAMGGIDSSQYTGDITYVTTQQTYGAFYGYYLVEIDAVSVDGVDIGDVSSMNTIGGTLVDSGTTLLYVTPTVYTSIKTAVQSSLSSISNSFFQWSSCIDDDDLEDLPTITFTIGDYDLVLEPADYLLYYEKCYYWGLSSSSVPIIGNIALQDLFIVFDKENNQVGFADAVCLSSTESEERIKQQKSDKQQQPQQQEHNAVVPQPQSQIQSQSQPQKLNFEVVQSYVPQSPFTLSLLGLIIIGATFSAFSYFSSRNQYQQIPDSPLPY